MKINTINSASFKRTQVSFKSKENNSTQPMLQLYPRNINAIAECSRENDYIEGNAGIIKTVINKLGETCDILREARSVRNEIDTFVESQKSSNTASPSRLNLNA